MKYLPKIENIQSSERIIKELEYEYRKKIQKILHETQKEIVKKAVEIHELRTTINVLIYEKEAAAKSLEENVLSNLKNLVCPCLEKLKQKSLDADQIELINVLESSLQCITSSFVCKLSSPHFKLTSMEIQIADLVKTGKTSKEISELLGISLDTVSTHRHHLRDKLGLKNKKAGLKDFLNSLGN